MLGPTPVKVPIFSPLQLLAPAARQGSSQPTAGSARRPLKGAPAAALLPLQAAGARRPRRFMPFSAGLRSCIGQPLARMNLHATLACLYSRFTFQLPPEVGGRVGG